MLEGLARKTGRQQDKYQPISQEELTDAEKEAAQTGRQTDRNGRVKAFTRHSDVLLCHPSRESITVSLRLAARHEKRQAQRGGGGVGVKRIDCHGLKKSIIKEDEKTKAGVRQGHV